MAHSLISIIIPAHNAATFLPICLQAIAQNDSVEKEILVVDDASTDDTVKIAEAQGAQVLKMKRNSGPSAARNRGAVQAKGDLLFFVDADVALHESALERVRSFLDRHPETAAVFGSYDTTPPARGTVSRYRNLVHHFVHQQGREAASTFWAGCGAIRKTVFQEMGGFDEALYPRCIEDIELGYRLRQAGHPIHLDKGLMGTHLKSWTFLSVIRTDIFCRAIPWIRLNRNRKMSPDDLNIKWSQKISVALVGLVLLCLAAGLVLLCFPVALLMPWLWIAAGLGLAAVLALNGGLFAFLLEQEGPLFTLKCIPLHLCYFIYSGASYIYVSLASRLGFAVRDGNSSRG